MRVLIRYAKADNTLKPEPGFITWYDTKGVAINGITVQNVKETLHKAADSGLESLGRYYYSVSYVDDLFRTTRGAGR